MFVMRTASEILDEIRKLKRLKSDASLGQIFGVKQTTISSWRLRNSLPYQDIVAFCAKEGLSTDTLFFKHINAQHGELSNDGEVRRLNPYTYKMDDLFSTRLRNQLEKIGKDIEWLSTISHIDRQRIGDFMHDKGTPSVDELESIARALGVQPVWLAERSNFKEDNWLFEFYKQARVASPVDEISTLYSVAVDNIIEKMQELIKLSPEDKILIVKTACEIHMKETPDSKETNAELIRFLVTLPALIHMKKKAPKRDPLDVLADY